MSTDRTSVVMDIEAQVRDLLADPAGVEAVCRESPVAAALLTGPEIVSATDGRTVFVPRPYQAELLNDWAEPRRIVVKSRQIGISQALAYEAYWRMRYHPPRFVLVSSRNFDEAKQFASYVKGFVGPGDLVRGKDTDTKFTFRNGSQFRADPPTEGAGRGFPTTDLYLDEFAFAPRAADVWQGATAAVEANGGTVTVFSSPKGRANLFHRLWQGSHGRFARYRMPYSVLFDEGWAARKRGNMTADEFAEEFGADFLESGGQVFRDADLDACAEGWLAEEPEGGWADQVTAWDVGRRRDHTVGVTLGLHGDAWHVADFERFTGIPYPEIQRRIEEHARRHPRAEVHVESNGVGDPVIENLRVRAEPFVTSAGSKVKAVQALALLVEKGRLKHRSRELDAELRTYQWDDEDLVQDCVMAAAIAAHAVGRRSKGIWVPSRR